jgi:hypothetical protein
MLLLRLLALRAILIRSFRGRLPSSRWHARILSLFFVPICFLFVLRSSAESSPSVLSPCQPFHQVNEDAFGLGGGADASFASEESFEVEVFNGQLYLGMEADNQLGARLWRTRRGVYAPTSQTDWEEVAADPEGNPFGNPNREQNDHVDSIAVFGNFLYVSTANRGVSQWGVNLYRSPSGERGTWQNVLERQGAGFGNPANVNFKDMVVFQETLCGGTQNWVDGAQVWCSQDGLTWVQKNLSGFGESAADATNTGIWSSMVFENALYFGVHHRGSSATDASDDLGKVFRTFALTENPHWEEVFSSPGIAGQRVDLLGVLDGFLYLATQSPQGVLIYRSPSGNAGSWQLVSLPGINGDSANKEVVADGAVIYDGMLYVAVSNEHGFQLWRTQGELQQNSLVDWQQVGDNGLGDAHNVRAELIVFNNHLYAWVTNYLAGQKVLRSHCLPCPAGQSECEIWMPDLPFRLYFPLIGY